MMATGALPQSGQRDVVHSFSPKLLIISSPNFRSPLFRSIGGRVRYGGGVSSLPWCGGVLWVSRTVAVTRDCCSAHAANKRKASRPPQRLLLRVYCTSVDGTCVFLGSAIFFLFALFFLADVLFGRRCVLCNNINSGLPSLLTLHLFLLSPPGSQVTSAAAILRHAFLRHQAFGLKRRLAGRGLARERQKLQEKNEASYCSLYLLLQREHQRPRRTPLLVSPFSVNISRPPPHQTRTPDTPEPMRPWPVEPRPADLYTGDQKILLLGEGDFSFALSLARRFGVGSCKLNSSFDPRGLKGVWFQLVKKLN